MKRIYLRFSEELISMQALAIMFFEDIEERVHALLVMGSVTPKV